MIAVPLISILTVIFGLIAYILYVVIGGHFFFPKKIKQLPQKEDGYTYHQFYDKIQNEIIDGIHIKRHHASMLIFYCHGSSGNIYTRSYKYRKSLLFPKNMNIFTFDYPGYGLSSGNPNFQNVQSSVYAAWLYVTKQLHYAPDKIIVFGEIMGGALASGLISRLHDETVNMKFTYSKLPRALILQSPFMSVKDVIRDNYLKVLAKISPNYLPTKDYLNKIRDVLPILIIHNDTDGLTETPHAEQLYDMISISKEKQHTIVYLKDEYSRSYSQNASLKAISTFIEMIEKNEYE